jgi:hypothetical protein
VGDKAGGLDAGMSGARPSFRLSSCDKYEMGFTHAIPRAVGLPIPTVALLFWPLGCGGGTDLSVTGDGVGTKAEWVVSAPIALTGQGACVPLDMAADEGGRVYVAVACQAAPAPIESGTDSSPVVVATWSQTRVAAGAPGVAYMILGDLHGDATTTNDGGKT